MKKILTVIPFLTLLIMCGDSPEDSAKSETVVEQIPEEKSADNASQEKMINGEVNLKLGSSDIELNRFRKNKTDITFTDENIVARITDKDDARFVIVTISGPALYSDKPQTLVPMTGAEEESTKAMITFMGFNNQKDPTDQIVLKQGNIELEELDEETLQMDLNFSGQGGQLMDVSSENSMDMSGQISIQFDNKSDLRKK